jgi:hypothetical protein
MSKTKIAKQNIMRTILKYIYILSMSFVMMTLFSCADRDLTNDEESVLKDGYISFVLYRTTAANTGIGASTRATINGQEQLNENYIDNATIFLYNDTTDAAVLTIQGQSVYTANGYYIVRTRITDELKNALSDGGYAYIVANPTGNFTDGMTLEEVKNTVISSDFTANSSGIQDKFTMSGGGEIEWDSNAAYSTVPLYRCAAKVVVYSNIRESVDETSNNSTVTYTPNLSSMTISLLNGVNKGKIGAGYTPADADYFNQQKTLQKTDSIIKYAGIEYPYTHIPFYSYPSSWKEVDPKETVVEICIPWTVKGENRYINTYYQLSINTQGRKLERNRQYSIYLNINNIGSTNKETPVKLSPASFTILPWGTVDVGAGSKTDENVSGEFHKYQYLTVDPKSITLNNQTSTTIKYTSSSALDKTNTKVTQVFYYTYNSTGNPISNTLISESELKDYKVDITSDKELTFTHPFDDTYTYQNIQLQVTNNEGLTETVVINQYPALYISTEEGGNVFVDGYFSRVENATMQGAYQRDDGNYYSGSREQYDPYSSTYYYIKREDYVQTPYDNLFSSLGNLAQTKITNVFVTAFNSENGHYTTGGKIYYYKIGDPRISSNWSSSDLEPWLYSYIDNNVYTNGWSSSDCTNLKIASNAYSYRSVIAPSFKVSSAWGQCGDTGITFSEAQKRAATYQENGYAAGRWRLPTEAEIMFVVAMQNKGNIPTLFVDGASYWASSGRYYYKGTFYDGYNTQCYVRCVYDTWYWGSEKCPTGTYTIKTTK